MGHLAAPSFFSTRQLAARALTNPSTVVWLGYVTVGTARFGEAVEFYSGLLGLHLRTVERQLVHFDRLRAVFVDAEGRDVVELVETPGEASHASQAGVSQIGFRLPRRTWQSLRARLQTAEVDYEVEGDVLTLHDPDGTRLRIESLGAC